MDISHMPDEAVKARGKLLETAIACFKESPGVVGIFLGGSIPAGRADAYSDIDLRVVVTHDSHRDFVDRRCEIPAGWPGFLFNEWVPDAQHCVSHFRPFGKIDIFYYDVSSLEPSPWYTLPIAILYDPKGIVADLVGRSRGLRFAVGEDEVDFSISKGLAAAHETYRRAVRGELFYAQTLLDELRQHMMQADDWLNDRTPETAVMAKFDWRGTGEVLGALRQSYPQCERGELLAALRSLTAVYREQVMGLHSKFRLARPLANDIAAFDVVMREGASAPVER